MKREKVEEFLIGLEKLTRKTGIEIAGCGCCDSPYLIDATISGDSSGYAYGVDGEDRLSWIDPSNRIDWEKYSRLIIKGRR